MILYNADIASLHGLEGTKDPSEIVYNLTIDYIC